MSVSSVVWRAAVAAITKQARRDAAECVIPMRLIGARRRRCRDPGNQHAMF